MHDPIQRLDSERQRLTAGAAQRPAGLGTVRFVVQVAEGHVATVLGKARGVLLAVNEGSRPPWPDEAAWRRRLPDWFVRRCAKEPTPEEARVALARWQSMTWEEQQRDEREREWALAAWLHWMKPEDRAWFWWDASIDDEQTATVAIQVDEWPFPWGALDWLLRASGAARVEPEDDESSR